MRTRRFVVDTNALVSRLLLPGSGPSRAVQKAIQEGDLLFSTATLEELARVVRGPKFDRYLGRGDREEFFRLLGRLAILVEITHPVKACRDASDDRILEVALNGRADAVITGAADLLSLHPFRGIPILTPSSFLDTTPGE